MSETNTESTGTAQPSAKPGPTERDAAFKKFKGFKSAQAGKKTIGAVVGASVAIAGTAVTAAGPGAFPQYIENGVCSADGGFANGKPITPPIAALNELKNRISAPDEDDINTAITADTFVNGPITDINSGAGAGFDPNKGADVTGYIAEIKSGGAETCNCQTTDQQWWDTHIYVSPVPGVTDKSKCFIVEVTPRFRLNGGSSLVNESTQQLESSLPVGTKIEITGWQFYDTEHLQNAANNPHHAKSVWRATCWEIHPVTDIKIIATAGNAAQSNAYQGTHSGPSQTSSKTENQKLFGVKHAKVE